MPVINSLLDTDLYKLTMMQGVLHQYPGLEVDYEFKCRNKVKWTQDMLEAINVELKNLCTLRFSEDELEYLRNIRFFKDDFIDFLKFFQLDYNHIQARMVNDRIHINIKGSWLSTILFEVPVLAIVNEIYYWHNPKNPKDGIDALHSKIAYAKANWKKWPNPLRFADFGTRRRYSHTWHKNVLEILKHELPEHLSGTSNVLLAKQLGLKPVGTMAHEWLQAGQAVGVRLVDSQKKMLQTWVDEYRGDLGIALSDVVGIDAFLKDFDLYFAKLYDGLRHDSGDPIEWGNKVINHYNKFNIDSKTKTLVFSDGLNFEVVSEIFKEFKDRAKVSFGIGTDLTNDFGHKPLQIVIKMTKANGQPVAKISDTPGKGMCNDKQYLEYLKKVFNV